MGLGLYVAWHLARAHGGSLELSSSAEQGTTFRLILPKLAPKARSPSRGTPAEAVRRGAHLDRVTHCGCNGVAQALDNGQPGPGLK